MEHNVAHPGNMDYPRLITYIDGDAAFAEAHVTWDAITDAQHQHEHEMMMRTIGELEEEDFKDKNSKEIAATRDENLK